MNESIKALAYIIMNSVTGSINGAFQVDMSEEQIIDEIGHTRNRILSDLHAARRLDPEGLYQNINELELTAVKASTILPVSSKSTKKVFHAKMPLLLSIEGLNPVGYIRSKESFNNGILQNFRILTGNDHLYYAADEFTAHKPAVWIDGTNLYLINPPSYFMKEIKVRAIFDNPMDLVNINGCDFQFDSPYPVPGSIKDMITGKIINDYSRYYRLGQQTE